MSIIEKERIGQGTEEKIERPKKYQVVYHYNLRIICPCSVSVLKNVFNMSMFTAHGLIARARDNGKETIFTGAMDEAETYTSEANGTKLWHGDHCHPMILSTEFKCEPVNN